MMSKELEVEQTTPDASRRTFLRHLAGLATIAAIPISQKATTPTSIPLPIVSPQPALAEEADPNADILVRMRADLGRALAKPVSERRWVMVIDLRKCVGCHACTISCIAENKLPPGVVYRPVLEEEFGTFPNVSKRFTPRPCMQCDNPPCVPVCPVKATWKREDGIVTIDYDKCIGCRYCITACPYNARTFDKGLTYNAQNGQMIDSPAMAGTAVTTQYETIAMYEYGRATERTGEESPVGNVRKCHFCLHRLENGMLPACTTTCIGRATYFGDANDPDSLVSALIALPNVMRLKPEMGTAPKVYYLQ